MKSLKRIGKLRTLLVSGLTSALVVGTAAAATRGHNRYSIRQIFARPGLTGFHAHLLKWSPDGDQLSFLLQQTGTGWQNLYVINASTGQRKLLVEKAALAPSAISNAHAREVVERYHIGDYGWLDSSRGLYVLKGDRLSVYLLSSGRAKRIGPSMVHAAQPSVAPGAKHVAWISGNTLHYASAAGTRATAVVPSRQGILTGVTDWVYREELGLEKGYAWSEPHGRYLAFLQFDERKVNRFPLVNYLAHPPRIDWQYYPHPGAANPVVRLGICNVENGRHVWARLDVPRGGYIARFGWLPGYRLAYAEVLNRAQTTAAIYLVRPRTGAARLLARKHDRWWVSIDDTPRFLKDGEFIWSGNQDGWHHLYLYSATGKSLRKLTPGDYNVLALAGVDAKRHLVYFTRYVHGPLDTELYRVALGNGMPQPVTRTPGVHAIRMSRNARHYVDRYSRAGVAPQVTLRSVSNAHRYVITPRAKLARYDLRPPHFVQIRSADHTTELYAELYLPTDFDSHKRYPVIMYQYGGPDVPPVVRNAWGGTDYLFDELLTRKGFVVFSVDNRSATYFSHIAQASIKGHFGPEELSDQLAALQWLKRQPWVDPQRIGLWGWSFGGYMTVYALTHAPRAWRAGIAVAPVTAWRYYDSIYTERYMGLPQKNRAGYREASAVATASRLSQPLLIAAGTFDDNVHWQNTLAFVQALIQSGKPYQLAVYPKKSHGITGTDDRTQLFTTMLRFWQRELEEQPGEPKRGETHRCTPRGARQGNCTIRPNVDATHAAPASHTSAPVR